MAISHPSPLRIWKSPAPLALEEPDAFRSEVVIPIDVWTNQKARGLYAREALDSSPTGPKHSDGAEPFSLQWFLQIEHERHQRRARWIPRLLEFSKHSGETLLCIGGGLGTDWVQFARHGAVVVVCCASAEDLGL